MHIRQLTTRLPQPVRFALRRALFRGEKRCVMCLSDVRRFVSHGGGAAVLEEREVVGGRLREDDRCPVCHAADRTRLMMLYLDEETEVGSEPLRVLHSAPDLGLFLWLGRQDGVDYVGTDLDGARYRHIENFVPSDLTAMPFEDGAFDLIICSHVLEHVPDDHAAMRELHRVLRPGGRALLLTPYAMDGRGTDEDPTVEDADERDRRFGQWDHVRLYDRADFLGRLEGAGFTTSLYDPFEHHPRRAAELHLNPDELLPVAVRPATTDGE